MKNFLANLKVFESPSPKIRLGRACDGGYVLPEICVLEKIFKRKPQ